MTPFWQDKERRRAALLSLLIHVAALLALVLFVALPRPTPLEPFIVIDVGTPTQSDENTDAATVGDPAPETPTPQVEAERLGRPADVPDPVEAPEPAETPPVAQPQEDAAPEEPVDAEAEPAPTDQPEEAEAEPAPADEPVEAEQPRPAPPAPAPVAPAASSVAETLPGTPATPLPQIEEEQLAPRPLAESIAVPKPIVAAEVPAVRQVAPQPRAEVAEARELPRPSVAADVADPQEVPRPSVSSTVADAQQVPTPSVSAQVTQASAVPTPTPRADVAPSTPVPRPSTRAEVATADPVPRPAARAAVSGAVSVPRPAATASVPSPSRVPVPEARAAVDAPPAENAGTRPGAVPPREQAPRGNRQTAAPVGGDALRPGQPNPPVEAEGLGAATTTEEGQGTGVPARAEPYSAFRRAPVAVLIDNANGYPQSGLVEAALVIEMPVEGGLTRLMPLYDNDDPRAVGPVRSARDYFVRIAESYDSVLVHDGGSPSALQAIAQSPTPTLNAFSRGELFARAEGRSAPYNLYSAGDSLRAAVNRLRAGGVRAVSGTIYRPPQDAREVDEITVPYGGTYHSGFAFQRTLGSYRWVRNDTPAVDAEGDQVRAAAVLVAQIEARPFPDDPEGRLYVPLSGGPATLYILGRAVDGAWYLEDGIRFRTAEGDPIDLRPFKTWMAFTPGYERRTER